MQKHSTPSITLIAALLGATLLTGCVDNRTTRPEDSTGGKVDLSSLVGMRARNLDSEMTKRGFGSTGGYQAQGAAITLWYNRGAHQCVKVETRQAKVAIIEDIAEGNCQ